MILCHECKTELDKSGILSKTETFCMSPSRTVFIIFEIKILSIIFDDTD
jgi:hypothetical protein